MNEMNVTNVVSANSAYQTGTKAETKKASKEENVKNEAAAVYEKSDDSKQKPATYNINKMSAEDRAELVKQLKADQASRQNQLSDIVSKLMTGQATTFAKTDDSMWKFLASGKFTVDAQTKAQAQADIAEDGYYGVKQTAQRMFDFACALAGDDVDKMKQMEAAMDKGFKMATKTWGGALPEICQNTMKAAHDMFSDYYASKEVAE
ncbi:MAG: hypothetical protein MJ126_06475 [Lachnospiraceae bacterium]|nr:hypothetical protein [Lachnospiraceae bacterium]